MSDCQQFLCVCVCVCVCVCAAQMCVNENLSSLYLRTSLACLQTLVCNLGLCHWHNKGECTVVTCIIL